ncbi:MAG: GGDEF domain-containing protein [Oscillospiraceae bacterium]
MKTSFKERFTVWKNNLSLNNYILSLFLALMVLASFASIIGNLITKFPMSANIKWIFSLFLCAMGFFLLWKDMLLEAYKALIFAAVIFLIILPSWFYGGGDNTITLLYLLLILVEAFLMLESSILKCAFAVVSSGVGVLLLTISYRYPEWVQSTQEQNIYADSVMQLVIVFLLITISISVYTSRYRRQNGLLRLLNERLEKLAITDEMTSIYNKRKIQELLSQLCGDEKINDIYVAMLDIDEFKAINDTYGHIVGDKVIVHMANYLAQIVGNGGFVGRYGGDEFMVILFNMADDEIKTLAGELLRVPDFSSSIMVTISGQDCASLTAMADELLMQAKRNAKNNAQLWGAIELTNV